jgi:hypothetical protein
VTVQVPSDETGYPRISVVIPAMNEERNLPHVFETMPDKVYEVILVDGNSSDNTVAVARKLWPDVRVISQTRKGKGNALACGFAAATGDVIAMVDADGSADPGEIPRFVDALMDGADFAKGSRFVDGGGSADLTTIRAWGNRALSMCFNVLYRTRYSDLCYGFNVFWRRHVDALKLDVTSPSPPTNDGRLWGDGFEIETLIHIRIAKAGLRVVEVGSYEHKRIHGYSNLNAVNDGLRVLRTILWDRRGVPPPEPVAPGDALGRDGAAMTATEPDHTTPSPSAEDPEVISSDASRKRLRPGPAHHGSAVARHSGNRRVLDGTLGCDTGSSGIRAGSDSPADRDGAGHRPQPGPARPGVGRVP